MYTAVVTIVLNKTCVGSVGVVVLASTNMIEGALQKFAGPQSHHQSGIINTDTAKAVLRQNNIHRCIYINDAISQCAIQIP